MLAVLQAYEFISSDERAALDSGNDLQGEKVNFFWALADSDIADANLAIDAAFDREPDLLVLRDRSDPRYQDRYWLGADLVVEVVSPDRPARDLVEKRVDYAEANVPEYWIVDPRDETITVLTLEDGEYVERGAFQRGQAATSFLLAGLAVDVATVFDAPEA